MDDKDVEDKLFKKLKELCATPKSFTEIMGALYQEIIHIFEENEECNTRILNNFFQILIHMNLHDVYENSDEPCTDAIKSQCDLFFDFMYFMFGDIDNLTVIMHQSLENSEKTCVSNEKKEYSRFLGNANCIMLFKKWFELMS